MSLIKGPSSAPPHPRHVVAVHRDYMIEHGLLCFGQKARDQSVPPCGREPFRIADVVAAHERGQMRHGFGMQTCVVQLGDADAPKQSDSLQIRANGPWPRLRRVLLEFEQCGTTIGIGHVQKPVDRGAKAPATSSRTDAARWPPPRASPQIERVAQASNARAPPSSTYVRSRLSPQADRR